MAQQRSGAGRSTSPTARSIKGPAKPAVLEPGQTAVHADPTKPLRVRATQTGYYDDQRRRAGDVFTIEAVKFSSRWMEKVGAHVREHTTDAATALAQAQNRLKGAPEPQRHDDDESVF